MAITVQIKVNADAMARILDEAEYGAKFALHNDLALDIAEIRDTLKSAREREVKSQIARAQMLGVTV